MSDHENDLGDIRYYAMQTGVVVDRNDPKKLGRVRVRIPGLCEPYSGWAWPVGTSGGGSAKRGLKYVPQVGAEVSLWFRGGDPDQPYYAAGHWGEPGGQSEIPTDAAGVDKSEDVHTLEFDRYAITIDERDPKAQSLIIKDKVSGDSIEFDGKAPGIVITATAALVIDVMGICSIDASTLILNGRKVSDGSSNI